MWKQFPVLKQNVYSAQENTDKHSFYQNIGTSVCSKYFTRCLTLLVKQQEHWSKSLLYNSYNRFLNTSMSIKILWWSRKPSLFPEAVTVFTLAKKICKHNVFCRQLSARKTKCIPWFLFINSWRPPYNQNIPVCFVTLRKAHPV